MADNVFPPDPNSLIGTVRLLITDWPETESEFIFADGQIQAFLALRQDNPMRAAATALMTLAANETLLYKYLRTDDLTVDGVKGGTELRLQARDLERQADAEDALDGDFFNVVYPRAHCNRPEYIEYSIPHGYPEWC